MLTARLMTFSIAVLVLGLFGPGAAQAQATPKDDEKQGAQGPAKPGAFDWLRVPVHRDPKKPRWAEDFDAGFQEAAVRNCPVLVLLVPALDEGIYRFYLDVIQTKKFAELSLQCVMVPALLGQEHAYEKQTVGDRMVRKCSLFDLPCSKHRYNYHRIFPRYMLREFQAPAVLILDAAGQESTRMEGRETSIDDLEEVVAFAQAELGESLPFQTFQLRMRRLRKLIDQRKRKGSGSILEEIEKLHEDKAQWEPLKTVLERAHGELLAEGQREVDQARKAIREGRVKEATDQLKRIEREYGGSAPGITAGLLLKDLRQKNSKGGG